MQKIIEYTYYHFRKKFFGENGKKEIDIQEITNMIEQIITMKKKLLTMQDQIEQSAYINNHFPETISRFFEKNIQDLCLIEIIDTYNDILIPYFYYFHNIFNGRSDEEISLFFKYETIEGKEESIKELLRETDSLQTQKEIIDIFRAFDEEHQK